MFKIIKDVLYLPEGMAYLVEDVLEDMLDRWWLSAIKRCNAKYRKGKKKLSIPRDSGDYYIYRDRAFQYAISRLPDKYEDLPIDMFFIAMMSEYLKDWKKHPAYRLGTVETPEIDQAGHPTGNIILRKLPKTSTSKICEKFTEQSADFMVLGESDEIFYLNTKHELIEINKQVESDVVKYPKIYTSINSVSTQIVICLRQGIKPEAVKKLMSDISATTTSNYFYGPLKKRSDAIKKKHSAK